MAGFVYSQNPDSKKENIEELTVMNEEENTPGSDNHRWLRYTIIFLIVVCAVLISGIIALAVKNSKLSKELRDSDNDWKALNSRLSETIRNKDRELKIGAHSLSKAQTDLEEAQKKSSRLQMEQMQELLHVQKKMKQLEEELGRAKDNLITFQSNVTSLVTLLMFPPPHCTDGWKSFKKSCVFFSTQKRTWEKSVEDCESMNPTLVTFTPENPDLMALLEIIRTPYWIGMWLNPQSVANWMARSPGPDILYTGDCMFFSDFDFNHDDCTTSKKYICEIKLDSD